MSTSVPPLMSNRAISGWPSSVTNSTALPQEGVSRDYQAPIFVWQEVQAVVTDIGTSTVREQQPGPGPRYLGWLLGREVGSEVSRLKLWCFSECRRQDAQDRGEAADRIPRSRSVQRGRVASRGLTMVTSCRSTARPRALVDVLPWIRVGPCLLPGKVCVSTTLQELCSTALSGGVTGNSSEESVMMSSMVDK